MSAQTKEKIIRKATLRDLPVIVQMLADDEFGKQRESMVDDSLSKYIQAFEQISRDDRAELLVVEIDEIVVATAQVNYLTYLTYQGGVRAQIEAVRVHEDYRGQGMGEFLITHIIEQAKQRGCHMVQLTTNKMRTRAKQFYEKLGFKATHEGMKLSD